MGMVVRTNTMALNAYRQLGMNNSAVAKSLEKLSSGFRINRAGDDAAGLAISEKMKAQITGLETASSNAQDGISLIQTAEGNLNEVHDMLNRMVELATKSANGTYTSTERKALQDEVDQLLDEIDRISQSANFNGTKLLDGTMGLNTDAITIGGTVAAIPGEKIDLTAANPTAANATTGTQQTAGMTTNLPAKAMNPTVDPTNDDFSYHLTKDQSDAIMPEFKINLAGLEVKAADGKTVTLTIGGVTITGTAGAADTSAAATAVGTVAFDIKKDETKTGEDIANILATLYSGDDADGKDTLKVGDFYYKATANGSEITFTAIGYHSGGAYKAGDGFDKDFVTDAKGPTQSGNNKGSVVIGGDADDLKKDLDNHDMYDVINAKVAAGSGRAGMDFAMNVGDIVADGNRLTIEDKTFVFKTDRDSDVKAGDGEILVDVSNYAAGAEQVGAAVDILSNYQTANFKIQAHDQNRIHIEQLESSTEKYTNYESLTSLFSARKADIGQGSQVSLDYNKLKAGDKVSIDGEEYTFVEKDTGGKNQVVIDKNVAANLVDALAKNSVKAKSDGVKVTIYGTVDKAPVIGGAGLTLQIGDTADDFNKMNIKVADMSAKGLGLKGISILTENSASDAIDKVKAAINSVSTARAGMGALQNRLDHTINNLDVAVENLSAANSRIRDTDMAKEMMNYTKMNVLVQSAQAMLAQANQQPQSVLQLLQ